VQRHHIGSHLVTQVSDWIWSNARWQEFCIPKILGFGESAGKTNQRGSEMKTKILGLMAVALLALPSAGNALVVTISGQGAADGNWNVTTVKGGLFASNPTAQEWWGNFTLASAFAQALGSSLGFPNACGWCGSDLAPFFAWQTQTTAVGPIFDARAMSSGGSYFNFQGFTSDNTFTFAVAQRVTTPPPGSPVPLPAAAWLLLSGLAGLGLIRRRKAN
jgi:hypothetical protein